MCHNTYLPAQIISSPALCNPEGQTSCGLAFILKGKLIINPEDRVRSRVRSSRLTLLLDKNEYL